MADSLAGTPVSPTDLGLTGRQTKVLALLIQGKSNKAIGRALEIAEPTVKRHVTLILKALKVKNRTEAAVAANALGWSLARGGEASRTGKIVVGAQRAPSPEHETVSHRTIRDAALVLPDQPSIVILPFANLSGDPAEDYFADGMVEEITVLLGRIPRLFVIASNSAFAYRDRHAQLKQIGAELGVRYVLAGSVRKNAEHIRIVVQMSDASLGRQIWADRFEGDLARIFELQDSVAASISAAIAPALRSIEVAQARRKPTENLTAYDLYLRALPPHRDSLAQNDESLRLLYKAIELDPSFGAAYGLAAYCHHMRLVFDWEVPCAGQIDEGVRLADLAAEWGESDPEALWMAGRTLAAMAGATDRGLALIDRSLSINPNSARAWWASGLTYAHLGNAATALDHFSRARRLNPRDTSEHAYWNGVALAHLFSGSLRPAKESIDKALIDWPGSSAALRTKAAICGLLDQIDDGRECVRQLLALSPHTTIANVRALSQRQMRSNSRGLKNLLDGLHRSGLPER